MSEHDRTTDSDSADPPEHVRANRDYWDAYAPTWVAAGERAWASDTPYWGIWQIPHTELPLLPPSMDGLDAVELGCGTGYGSAWMTRRGASCVGVDVSAAQLATARRLAEQHALDIRWIEASAEAVPLPDASFDFAFSEYGAAIWCDPRVWIPEAARLLRPGGRLVFLGGHPLAAICSPPDGSRLELQLHRSLFDLHVIDWRDVEVDPGGVEFCLSHSAWYRVFHEAGFVVENYLEPRPSDPTEDRFMVPPAWARRYPSEQVWMVRKMRA